jgi:enterochelin esterase-like enzyme
VAVTVGRQLVLRVEDPGRELRAVRLRGDLWKREHAPEFRRLRGVWTLRLPRPRAVDRIEYELELVRVDGTTEVGPDPTNPLRAPGPFGDKSVLELPGYAPPTWLEDGEAGRGTVRRLSLPSRRLRGRTRALLWSAAGSTRTAELPLLVVHDGPEYAAYASLLQFLDSAVAELELPAMRALLLAPLSRDEHYSASSTYADALARDLIPTAVARAAPVPEDQALVGMGASLGALATLHAHRRHADLFGGLFLQSGSFFRPRLDGLESGFRRFSRITRFTADVDRARDWPHPVPVSMTCGTGEENLANNRALRDTLAEQGYATTLDEHPDAHNWVSWRDSLDPPLVTLLARLWG